MPVILLEDLNKRKGAAPSPLPGPTPPPPPPPPRPLTPTEEGVRQNAEDEGVTTAQYLTEQLPLVTAGVGSYAAPQAMGLKAMSLAGALTGAAGAFAGGTLGEIGRRGANKALGIAPGNEANEPVLEMDAAIGEGGRQMVYEILGRGIFRGGMYLGQGVGMMTAKVGRVTKVKPIEDFGAWVANKLQILPTYSEGVMNEAAAGTPTVAGAREVAQAAKDLGVKITPREASGDPMILGIPEIAKSGMWTSGRTAKRIVGIVKELASVVDGAVASLGTVTSPTARGTIVQQGYKAADEVIDAIEAEMHGVVAAKAGTRPVDLRNFQDDLASIANEHPELRVQNTERYGSHSSDFEKELKDMNILRTGPAGTPYVVSSSKTLTMDSAIKLRSDYLKARRDHEVSKDLQDALGRAYGKLEDSMRTTASSAGALAEWEAARAFTKTTKDAARRNITIAAIKADPANVHNLLLKASPTDIKSIRTTFLEVAEHGAQDIAARTASPTIRAQMLNKAAAAREAWSTTVHGVFTDIATDPMERNLVNLSGLDGRLRSLGDDYLRELVRGSPQAITTLEQMRKVASVAKAVERSAPMGSGATLQRIGQTTQMFRDAVDSVTNSERFTPHWALRKIGNATAVPVFNHIINDAGLTNKWLAAMGHTRTNYGAAAMQTYRVVQLAIGSMKAADWIKGGGEELPGIEAEAAPTSARPVPLPGIE